MTKELECSDPLDQINLTEISEELLPLVYEELRTLARQQMAKEKPGQTLAPTALVHEAYLRLVGSKQHKWNSRAHFFCAAATAMRRILVEVARRKNAVKHGGGSRRISAELDELPMAHQPSDLLAVDRHLELLKRENADIGRLVEIKYFLDLTLEESAREMGISPRTARRYWAYAKAWIRDAIESELAEKSLSTE